MNTREIYMHTSAVKMMMVETGEAEKTIYKMNIMIWACSLGLTHNSPGPRETIVYH
ncbi:hypothetical protein YC2023_106409 [Brassica napus]